LALALLGRAHHLLLFRRPHTRRKAAAAIGRLEDIPDFLEDFNASLDEAGALSSRRRCE